jgi:hypothetical protein
MDAYCSIYKCRACERVFAKQSGTGDPVKWAVPAAEGHEHLCPPIERHKCDSDTVGVGDFAGFRRSYSDASASEGES